MGAAILAKLDSKNVELVMGAALLLIIVAEQISKAVLSYKQRAYLNKVATCEDYHSLALTHAEDRCPEQHEDTASQPLLGDQQQQQRRGQEQYGLRDSEPASSEDCTVCLSNDASVSGLRAVKEQHRGAPSSSDVTCTDVLHDARPAAGACGHQDAVIVDLGTDVVAAAAAELGACSVPLSSTEQQGLLAASSSSIRQTRSLAANDGDPSGSSSSTAGAPVVADISNQPLRWPKVRAWLVVLGVGSIAGTLSGIMEGLTGERLAPLVCCWQSGHCSTAEAQC